MGATRSGRAGNGAGFNAYQIWASDNTTYASNVEVRNLNEKYSIAATQHHYLIDQTSIEGNAARKTGRIGFRNRRGEAARDDSLCSRSKSTGQDPGVVAEMGETARKGSDHLSRQLEVQGLRVGDGHRPDGLRGCNACVRPARRKTISRSSAKSRF